MRALFASSLIVILAAASSTAVADDVLRSHSFDTTGIEHLRIEHRAGELTLAPAAGDRIEVELRIEPQQNPLGGQLFGGWRRLSPPAGQSPRG